MSDQFKRVAEAFSRKAAVYDAFGHNHINLSRMRRKVYDHIGRWVPAGGRLLELNAGTGLDAVELVKRGYTVHATDIAPQMVAAVREKVTRFSLQEHLTVQQCSFTELQQVQSGPFDAVYSNFGGLNCIADLTLVTRHLPRLLKPHGTVTWVIMPPFYPWEHTLIFKDWRVATRRWHGDGVEATVEGVRFQTYYFTVRQVRQAFGERFEQVALEALSLVTPPADNFTFARRRPYLYAWLVKLDDWLAVRRPFNRWGDFFIITMQFKG